MAIMLNKEIWQIGDYKNMRKLSALEPPQLLIEEERPKTVRTSLNSKLSTRLNNEGESGIRKKYRIAEIISDILTGDSNYKLIRFNFFLWENKEEKLVFQQGEDNDFIVIQVIDYTIE
jgi:hypothetical protein